MIDAVLQFIDVAAFFRWALAVGGLVVSIFGLGMVCILVDHKNLAFRLAGTLIGLLFLVFGLALAGSVIAQGLADGWAK